uniref:phosphoglycerate mutase 1-like n=1 Tax=Styela clava TaxID=7725 RepID=UPI0019396B34|nr:phosphoglycerate mutase 1-like [Styela clava]
MDENHPFYDQITNDKKYADVPKDQMPFAENLKQTFERTIPYWEEEIVPQIKAGKKILIYAHCNSLRSIVQHIDNLPDNEIVKLNIPPGIPFVYEFDEAMKPVVSMKFLDDEDKVKNMMASLAARGTKGGQLMPRFG